MRKLLLISVVALFCACKKEVNPLVSTIDISNPKLIAVEVDSSDFREFRVLDSRYLELDSIWRHLNSELEDFNDDTYNRLKPYILEQDIPSIQKYISEGKFNYEQLTKFYLYRIRKFDRHNELSLNAVISVNPNVIAEARAADNTRFVAPPHAIFGMPILLKDNINASAMPTTAGAVALHANYAQDAFITNKLKANGALILGKANLSEWAYFFCGDCPSGYSALGGQTLNPYGRRIMDTGGSSSGSGVAVAANFCVAAIGSETSGSILSPSSANSIVGLKPTIGVLSRSGIVPISSTLDTPGPMTKNVTDNAIVMDAMLGYDANDSKSVQTDPIKFNLDHKALEGRRFGSFSRFMNDSLYLNAMKQLKDLGAEIIEVKEEEVDFSGFLSLLNLDMRNDLPQYLNTWADTTLMISSVKDVIDFNKADSLQRAPYGQRLFQGIVDDKGNEHYLDSIKTQMKALARTYFNTPISTHNLDGFVSINNRHAGFAALAEYPAITVPMGYTDSGLPRGLTVISRPLTEWQLLNWGFAYEQASQKRRPPINYN